MKVYFLLVLVFLYSNTSHFVVDDEISENLDVPIPKSNGTNKIWKIKELSDKLPSHLSDIVDHIGWIQLVDSSCTRRMSKKISTSESTTFHKIK